MTKFLILIVVVVLVVFQVFLDGFFGIEFQEVVIFNNIIPALFAGVLYKLAYFLIGGILTMLLFASTSKWRKS